MRPIAVRICLAIAIRFQYGDPGFPLLTHVPRVLGPPCLVKAPLSHDTGRTLFAVAAKQTSVPALRLLAQATITTHFVALAPE